MSYKSICTYWQHPVEKSHQKIVLFEMLCHSHFTHESLISYIYIDFFEKILTKLKKVWIENTNV